MSFIRTRLLPVSGAFHTALMEPAVEPLRDVLRKIEVRRPEISVHSNVDGKRYMHDKHVRNQLAKQLVSPVKWEQTLHEIYERAQGQEFPHTYEVGPGRQLGSTLQKCNMKAFKNYTHVDVVLPLDWCAVKHVTFGILISDKCKKAKHCFLFKHFIVLVGLESPASFSSTEMLLEEEVTINWPNYPAIDPKHTHAHKKTIFDLQNPAHIWTYICEPALYLNQL